MVAKQRLPELTQLVFTCPFGRQLVPEELQALVNELTRTAARSGLTGLMLQQGDSFYAVLEGPSRRLLARMEQMIADPRFGPITVLKEKTVPSRRFGNWSFGVLPPMQEPSTAAEAFILKLAQRPL